jgi:hypothetical protein
VAAAGGWVGGQLVWLIFEWMVERGVRVSCRDYVLYLDDTYVRAHANLIRIYITTFPLPKNKTKKNKKKKHHETTGTGPGGVGERHHRAGRLRLRARERVHAARGRQRSVCGGVGSSVCLFVCQSVSQSVCARRCFGDVCGRVRVFMRQAIFSIDRSTPNDSQTDQPNPI